MKRKVLFRALSGIPLGIALETVISVVISALWAGGEYLPYEPTLAETVGSPLGAMVLQTALCALLGAGFGGLSVVWALEGWSLARQTAVYFLGVSLVMMPVAWFTHWMEHTVAGFLGYFGVFVIIFAVIWLIQYARAKRDVRKLNEKLNKQ